MQIIPEPGQRQLIIGKTGSGKTSGAIFVLKRLETAPAIIYDTKIEPKFEALPNSVVVSEPWEIMQAVEAGEHDYIVVRPPVDFMDNPDALDEMYLRNHYHNLQGLPAYIDEALTFHKNSQAGPGLIALLTRGRSKGISTIISSQRPSRISRFAVTEIDKAMIYRLQDKLDRKRLDDLITDFSTLDQPKRFHFWFWDSSTDDDDNKPRLFSPVPLDVPAAYVDVAADDANDVPERTDELPEKDRRLLWI